MPSVYRRSCSHTWSCANAAPDVSKTKPATALQAYARKLIIRRGQEGREGPLSYHIPQGVRGRVAREGKEQSPDTARANGRRAHELTPRYRRSIGLGDAGIDGDRDDGFADEIGIDADALARFTSKLLDPLP